MTELVIQLTGEVVTSNFDDWKRDLIARIRAVDTELRTDSQFAQASRDVQHFKAAELTLKQAKQSAISQAADIQRLFAAIDEVAEEVRQVRLSLERQVKRRKLEIKEAFIRAGRERIRACIEQMSPDFQAIDHSEFLDPGHFELAVKGKASVRGVRTAIDVLCERLRERIDARAASVEANAIRLDRLPGRHRALFQDRAALLALPPEQLDGVIDERIAVFEAQTAAGSSADRSASLAPGPGGQEPGGMEVDEPEAVDGATEVREGFRLTMELVAAPAEAERLLDEVKRRYGHDPRVVRIDLDRS